MLIKPALAVLSDPPNVLVRGALASQQAAIGKILKAGDHPPRRKSILVREFFCGVRRVGAIAKISKNLRVCNRGLSTRHHAIFRVSRRGIIYHRYGITSMERVRRMGGVSSTGRIITIGYDLHTRDRRNGARITRSRNGPEGPAVAEHPMTKPHDRTKLYDGARFSNIGTPGGGVRDDEAHKDQLHGIVGRHPIQLSVREANDE